MAYKSDKQPLCRYCGKKIKKVSDQHTFWSNKWQERIDPSYVAGKFMRPSEEVVLPQTKAEAQRLVNQPILSVSYRYSGGYDENYRPIKGERLGIESVTTWDGESYSDEFFCTGEHARMFGYLLAMNGHATQSFQSAREKQIQEEGK